jgi:microcystin-dependent protein
MTVPTSISQLSTTPSLNSPAGTEPIGNNLAPYLNTMFAFIAQLANGSGLNQSQALNMKNNQINNLAPGVANSDALTVAQLKDYEPIGTIKLWSGTPANIYSAFGPNWVLCNGQNGTPNLMDKFVIGAGNAYASGATGGTTSYTLSVANMPVHNHGISDPGHNHGVNDPGHAHGVNDPGHAHSYISPQFPSGGSNSYQNGPQNTTWRAENINWATTSASGTGISIAGSGTGIWLNGSGTGISVQNAGSGAALTIIPPYYALCYVMKIANN